MPKPIIQDMIPKKGQHLNNSASFSKVTPRVEKQKIIEEIKEETVQEKITKTKPVKITPSKVYTSEKISRTRGSHHFRWKKILFIIFILALITYAIFNLFESANIDIKAKKQLITYNKQQFIASKSLGSDINFEITMSNDQESKPFTLSESSVVSEKAKGVVTLYNSYTTKPQTIILNTFIEDKNGLAYKTDKTVTIPGYKMFNGKVTPGQVDVPVTAFLDGESYNGAPTDFIITAFKNTSKAKKIYGKASTPMTGGAKGLIYRLSAKDKENLSNYASSTLKDKLFAKMSVLVPKDYVLYPNASTFTYHIDDTIMSKDPGVSVSITTTSASVIFREQDLTKAIIKNALPDLKMPELAEVELGGVRNLVFNFTNKGQVISKDMQSISFNLTGSVNAVWNPDIISLNKNLVGVSNTLVKDILSHEPGIASSDIRLFPWFKSSLPKTASRIHINVN